MLPKPREKRLEGCGYTLTAPPGFLSRLANEFPHFRLRWSQATGCWHLEQQVGRAALAPLWISPIDDRMIRARDGYRYVMSIYPGDRTACPQCRLEIKVPKMKFARFTCDYCVAKAQDPRTSPKERRIPRLTGGYFPLSETLLEHLRKIDFRKGGNERQAEEVKLNAIRQEWEARQQVLNTSDALGRENFNQFFGIPSVGYTGNSRIIHRERF